MKVQMIATCIVEREVESLDEETKQSMLEELCDNVVGQCLHEDTKIVVEH